MERMDPADAFPSHHYAYLRSKRPSRMAAKPAFTIRSERPCGMAIWAPRRRHRAWWRN